MTSNASGTPIAPAPRPKLQIAAPRTRRFGLTSILLALALVVAVGGLAFAVGRLTAPPAAASTFGAGRFGNGAANGGTGAGAGAGGFRGGLGGFAISGTVTAVNGSTITIQEANGRTIDVTTSGSTTYQDATTGSASDVQNGSSVVVQIDTSNGGAAGAFRGGAGSGGTVSVPASAIIVGAK